MPYHSLGEEERAKIWDDGLHFTEEGYAKIGEIVGRRLLGIIEGGEGRVDVN
jgi:lysophospholipase L1-like esterase